MAAKVGKPLSVYIKDLVLKELSDITNSDKTQLDFTPDHVAEWLHSLSCEALENFLLNYRLEEDVLEALTEPIEEPVPIKKTSWWKDWKMFKKWNM